MSWIAGERPGILMVISHFPPAVGGGERHTELLAGALTRAWHSVCVATQRSVLEASARRAGMTRSTSRRRKPRDPYGV